MVFVADYYLKYEDEVKLKELMPDLFETVKTFKGSKVMEINYKNEVKIQEEHSPWINYRELKIRSKFCDKKTLYLVSTNW